MPPAKQVVTLKDIAAQCGVTAMTVSWALRGDERNVSAPVRDRIVATAARLGYNPAQSHAARQLRCQGVGQRVLNRVLALPLPIHLLTDPYFARLVQGLGAVLEQEHYGLLLNFDFTRHPVPPATSLPEPLCRGDVDGLFLLIGGQDNDLLLARLRAEPTFGTRPIIGILEALPGTTTQVLTDDYDGACQLAAHLLACGHRHLLIHWQGSYAHLARYRGLEDTYRAAGLDPAQHLHYFKCTLDQPAASLDRVLQQHLRRWPQATALVAPNDAAAVVHWAPALDRLGRHIPDDLSLVGFDDTYPLPGPGGENLLTTVRLPLDEIGRQAARLMLAAIGAPAAPPPPVTLPVKLIARGSVRTVGPALAPAPTT